MRSGHQFLGLVCLKKSFNEYVSQIKSIKQGKKQKSHFDKSSPSVLPKLKRLT
jgi:hypothetical protein